MTAHRIAVQRFVALSLTAASFVMIAAIVMRIAP